ncbi:phospholipid carrier-dependent glycosyltransferase [Novosphingobium mangrovi (ex Huang et al. 2023)]|uniref:Polyprenol-phosphate-mannose--protein mannosyltransferase n=1 Tax=Novosphingobium mangrovi (ex Huang et al. 2023) TaxID=2976432 RepID=A0ABT2I1J0_9SPHN|nr:phospholipid carrier-dependent glycosyltransferase [Novosphingobium mangrovi (ex Huang et al. 2023)]MCT2398666.1 phospholipid carrier-dependent glycosyltransferase [Novosphingobium mangrovi (ex Huang et al. 2023)]
MKISSLSPRLTGALLGLFSLALFCWHIARPDHPYFDETHYVPAARALLERGVPLNPEHPLFAKALIAAGIALFGDNPLGWRLPGALCGTLGIVAVYWIAIHVFADRRAALATALLVLFNQTYFIQARIAMLEMPMMAFLLIGAGCLFHAGKAGGEWRRWAMVGAVCMGLATGSKWLAAPYAGLYVLLACRLTWKRATCESTARSLFCIREGLTLSLIMGIVYLATFLPLFFSRQAPMTLAGLIPFQFKMLALQRGSLAPHPYQSSWWQWPLMLRPIWYLFEKREGAYQAVLLVGNPVLYWSGLLAGLAILSGWMKSRSGAAIGCTALFAGSVLMWAVIPKQIGFFYYYNFSAIILCFVAVAFLMALGSRGERMLHWYVSASALAFLYFLPIISASQLPTDDTWTQWVWMKSWY